MSDDRTNEQVILDEFEYLMALLKNLKPNDRSEQDRYYAITNTEVEKAFGLFKTFVTWKD